MTALNDAERAAQNWTTARPDRPAPVRSSPPAETAAARISRYYPAWMPSRRFIAAVIAIGGMQLLATMDSTVAIVALPRIQNDLSLSDAGRSWVITAYVLTFGGLMLLGGRLGDTIGRKRTFIVGVTLFTIASALCGVAWDDVTLVIARLLQGVGAAIASPTGFALVATTFAKGPARNAATAVFGAMTGVGSVMGLVVGGALTEVSWRLAFLVNVPIGLAMIFLARTALRETNRERMKLDAAGALLATLACTAAVFAIAMGIGLGGSSQLVSRFPPRVVVIAGGALVVGAMVYGSTFNGAMPYFPNLIVPVVIAGIGIGMVVVPVALSAIAGVGFDQIGPTSAIALMLQNLGGPVVLAVIQAVITSRTLYLGGINGPVKNMNAAQLHALDHGYTYGLLWVAGVTVIVGAVSLLIGYTAEQVAHAQEVKDAIDGGEM